jgi:hypothetical protein
MMILSLTKIQHNQGQVAMVYWLGQMAHNQEVVGSNPDTVYWMDVSDDASFNIK